MQLGCDITVVGSGDECLQAFTPEHNVVLLDCDSSGTDIYNVCVLIRQKISTNNDRPYVVALTRNIDRLIKENCMRVRMDGLVTKPVSVDQMRRILSELLDHGGVYDVQ